MYVVAGSHKGTFRDRRLLIRRRFRKGLFCSRWSRRRRRRLLVFLSLRESTPADLLPIVPLLIDRNFISITSYFDRSQARFFRRLQIPLAFPCKRTKINIFRASLFLLRSRTYNFQKTGAKDTFVILDFNEMRISPS